MFGTDQNESWVVYAQFDIFKKTKSLNKAAG